jgi:hypothetical protein
LVLDDHELEVVVYVPIPGSYVLARDPASGKWQATGEKAPLRVPKRLEEDEMLSELGISESTELLLVWKLDSIRRCAVCGRKMKLFCADFGFDAVWELLTCSNCKRADWVIVGEDHDFIRESSGVILSQTEDRLAVQHEDKTTIYELYGQPQYYHSIGCKVRLHRSHPMTGIGSSCP